MKKSKIKAGVVIFACIALFPLFITEVNAALIGPPNPPPVTTVGAQANLYISYDGWPRFGLNLDIQANVLEGVRLDWCVGWCNYWDYNGFDGYSIECIDLYHDFYYLAGALWKYKISWVYRVVVSGSGYFEFTFFGEINICGEHSFGYIYSEGGGAYLGPWNFEIYDITDNFRIAMDIWLNLFNF
ncbi:MAG: hypothetical protein CEE43_18945 [Promethearchaeota archaeon Loki_b32]|nr:MAG: hypothetical protein CEE43_18945 [Candidatus Lokiarchaeota archaeon Loki_b32]